MGWSTNQLGLLTETPLHAANGSALTAAETICLNIGNSVSKMKLNLLITGRKFGNKNGESGTYSREHTEDIFTFARS